MTSVNDIVQFILQYCKDKGDLITHLKLQKLLYFIQGWHLAIYGPPAFEEDIQAWPHGPVVSEVYQKFKTYGWQPISLNGKHDFDLSKRTQKLIEEVLLKYDHSAGYLEQLTHESQPWIDARHGLAPDQRSNVVISKEAMKKYFKSKLK
jgi:uncharacterized phage-associated protein